MIAKNFFCLVFLVALCSLNAFSQKVYTPEKGSAERAAILNALRVPIEKELRQKIQFSINSFKTNGTWTFLDGEPQKMNGGKPNYKGTNYEELTSDDFDNNFFALLKKTGGKWKVVTYAIGCSDVCYADWWKRFKAPKAIFPYTE